MITACEGMQRKGLLLQASHDITTLITHIITIDSTVEKLLTHIIDNTEFPSKENMLNTYTLLHDYHNEITGTHKLLHDYCTEIFRVSQLIQ